jgi:hypothetical protein
VHGRADNLHKLGTTMELTKKKLIAKVGAAVGSVLIVVSMISFSMCSGGGPVDEAPVNAGDDDSAE